MISKVHVTIGLAVIALVAAVCATVILCMCIVNGVDLTTSALLAAPFITLATTCIGGIAGVAVPTQPSSSS